MSIKIRQHDITDCGAACLASVAFYHKLELPLARIRQIAGADTQGTNILGMVTAAEKLGFIAKGVTGNKDALSKIPLPAIAHVVVKRSDRALNHYVVLYKVSKEKLEYMDPADGKIHKTSIEEFGEIWSEKLIVKAVFHKLCKLKSYFQKILSL